MTVRAAHWPYYLLAVGIAVLAVAGLLLVAGVGSHHAPPNTPATAAEAAAAGPTVTDAQPPGVGRRRPPRTPPATAAEAAAAGPTVTDAQPPGVVTPAPAPPAPGANVRYPSVRWHHSTAVGLPWKGRLENGVLLPAYGRDYI